MTDTNKLPQPLDMTGGIEYKTVWQKFCDKCGHVYPKTGENSNVCPECGAVDARAERKIFTT